MKQLLSVIHQRFILPIYTWRYWPMELLYLPLTLYIFFVGSLKTQRLFYFAAANPKVPLGGFASDSKFSITSAIPDEFKPKTFLVLKSDSTDELNSKLENNTIHFPLFTKPDIGEGGFLVKKINSMPELIAYHTSYNMNYLVQEYIDDPIELSILIHNADGQLKISSITERKYLSIEGDGISTLENLLYTNKRIKFRINNIIEKCKDELHVVLKKGEVYQPILIGNWDYGANYIERTEMANHVLTQVMEDINKTINLFNYARYDIKCKTEEELFLGFFKILEINGVKGEPIHIYDSKYSLAKAYSEIFKHWGFIMKISKRNIASGTVCPSALEGFKLLKQHSQTKKMAVTKKGNYA
jgi:hypothetical protein